MTRNTSLPVSAQECAASASSDADPVTTAAIDFATPTRTLAPRAIHTVLALSVPLERDRRESESRRSGSPLRGSSSAAGLTPQVSRMTSPCGYGWRRVLPVDLPLVGLRVSGTLS